VEATKQNKEEKREKPVKPDEKEDMPQRQHCPAADHKFILLLLSVPGFLSSLRVGSTTFLAIN
jgi:hypothetical protein